MPPRRQNPTRQQAIQDVEMEELHQQIQRLQERLEAFEGQQAQHPFKINYTKSVHHHHPQQNATHKSTNLGIKIDIPNFEGRLQLNEFIDWLHFVARVFELKDIPDNKCVKIVAIKLKKHASIWWENLHHNREREGRSKIRTWEKMCRYQDEVWCDVIPVDACHLLLGCPWQFDQKAIHDSHANTYSFVKDGVKIKLTPLKPEETLEKKDEDKALISISTFQKLHRESGTACLLLLCKVNDAISPFLEEIQSLCEEFSNVVPDEIPPGLPLMRDIEHAIDFIPRSVILNKLAYWMNP
ncbi:hypothetical protein SLEP1_g36340 [Rubroshorea leprosula]|uniref:Uncharacterized protein n=1 Tax=Rubroshorea leprosula TaxID=152421 RepID=A0AAV5KR62_9ROSI|nr:hypothetical protein SLEP1_g36340 [Rubroshorea leprosula]